MAQDIIEKQDSQNSDGNIMDVIKARFASVRCTNVEQLLSIMANPIRFHILCALSMQQFTVNELVDLSGANLSNVSQQLKMMWMAGYLDKERNGKQIYYRLKDDRIEKIIRFFETLFPENEGPDGPGCVD